MVETVKNLSIIIPTYNEKDNIPILLYMIQKYLGSMDLDYEVVVVDDNSPDGTYEVVEDLKRVLKMDINLLRREKKLGLGSSYVFALSHCKHDFVLIMDSDLSHHPKYLPHIVQIQRLTGCDVVSCTRYNNSYFRLLSPSTRNRPHTDLRGLLCGGDAGQDLTKSALYGELLQKLGQGPEALRSGASNWPLRRIFISKSLNFLCRLLFNSKFTDMTGSYRLYRKRHLLSVIQSVRNRGFLFQMELALICEKRLGLRIHEVPIVFIERLFGYSKLNLKEVVSGLVGLARLTWDY